MKRLLMSMAVLIALVAAAPKGGYQIGDTVADFRLKNVDGKMVSLSDWKDTKGFIVIFDCNTCPVSQKYNERIKALSKKYKSQGFPVVAINPNSPEVSAGDSFDEMVKYAKRKEYDFPYLYDESQQTVKDFGATNTPHVFILKRAGGELKVAYIGAIDNNTSSAENATEKYVESAVDALLSGKDPAVNKTKAIGCSVKWKNA